jgi:site-specific recombinase XerD
MPLTVKQITCKEHGTEYKTWMVDGYADGKRVRIRCKTEQEARIKKSEQETKAINAARSTRFVQTRLSDEQLNEAETSFARLAPKYTLTQAVDFFLTRHHAPDFEITINEATTRFLAAQEGTIRARTLRWIRGVLEAFTDHANGANVHEVTPANVEEFMQSLRAKNGTDKATKKTWNNYAQVLHQFFDWCRDQRYVAENPATDIKRFQIHSGHIDVLPIEKCMELMQYVSGFKEGRLVPYFGLALFTGLRPDGELRKLAKHPELISLENKVIRVTAEISKTGKPRQIRIRPNLLKWLQRYPGEILPTNCAREIFHIRQKFQLSHDVLRHTFISAHVMAFGSFAETAIEAGNSETIIREHYFNVITKPKAKAFWRIEPES